MNNFNSVPAMVATTIPIGIIIGAVLSVIFTLVVLIFKKISDTFRDGKDHTDASFVTAYKNPTKLDIGFTYVLPGVLAIFGIVGTILTHRIG